MFAWRMKIGPDPASRHRGCTDASSIGPDARGGGPDARTRFGHGCVHESHLGARDFGAHVEAVKECVRVPGMSVGGFSGRVRTSAECACAFGARVGGVDCLDVGHARDSGVQKIVRAPRGDTTQGNPNR